MKILAIETSCDETSVAVVERTRETVEVLSESTASSIKDHASTGGIIPERAARRQLEYMLPVIESVAKMLDKEAVGEIMEEVDGIAVTVGPGLIGSLLVGVECAKTLSYIHKNPLIPVNHLLGHLYANFFGDVEIEFPFVGLIASGGHTDLLFFERHDAYKWLGGTRDDAVGEALDKIARLLGLSYPGGPEIEKVAMRNVGETIKFQSPLAKSDDYDFSYSGMKSEVARYIEGRGELDEEEIAAISDGVQRAAIDVLVDKTLRAGEEFRAESILIGGGVVANSYMREMFEVEMEERKMNVKLYMPDLKYTGDNAAMIGAYACFGGKEKDFRNVSANPGLDFLSKLFA